MEIIITNDAFKKDWYTEVGTKQEAWSPWF